MNNRCSISKSRRDLVIQKIRDAAAQESQKKDPWSPYELETIPAEKVKRHWYNAEKKSWTSEITIVKMESKPFTHGAMRHCYRMKMIHMPPNFNENHRFYKHGWSKALNYVAKSYLTSDGKQDVSDDAKEAVFNDIILQYEAQHWARKFNDKGPPKRIIFIMAYVVEFIEREGSPVFAVERFISGTDSYGAGFTKHNTNSGYVDETLGRITPHIFSAFSFYSSEGTRLVADIQGVGDLYTDPQVLSDDFRFGDGDLGPRGMALFFQSFVHGSFADSIGIPIFPLSRNELRYQEKQIKAEGSESNMNSPNKDDEAGNPLNKFEQLDINRINRKSVFQSVKSDEKSNTLRRSNLSFLADTITSPSIHQSMSKVAMSSRPSNSEMDEMTECLSLATIDSDFDFNAFNRLQSGDLRESNPRPNLRGTVMISRRKPMSITDALKVNLGKVHYHLALLHGMGRFPEIVTENETKETSECSSHDVSSVLFHLCHAASLQHGSACLSLARVRAGLKTSASTLLQKIVPVDFEESKALLRRTLDGPPPSVVKAAAGCLMVQILEDESNEGMDDQISKVIEETLLYMEEAKNEHLAKKSLSRPSENTFEIGSKVEANYCLEGTFYPARVVKIEGDGTFVVEYDDDGSTETLSNENIKCVEGSGVVKEQTPLSDGDALGLDNLDEKYLFKDYQLEAQLAELKAKHGAKQDASELYQSAADKAMNDGKMQSAAKWSNLSCQLSN